MSPFAQAVLAWIVNAGMLLLLWAVVALGGWLLYSVLKLLMPAGPAGATERLLGYAAPRGDLWERFNRRRVAAWQQALGGTAARLIVEARHRDFARRLGSLRNEVSAQLRNMQNASAASAAPTLIELLKGFRAETRRALSFGEIDDALPEQTVALRQARSRLWLSLLGSTLLGGFNFMLLYLFFSNFPTGFRLPGTKVDAIVMAPLLLPLSEFAAGFFTEFLDEERLSRFMRQLTKWSVVGGLAMVECFVFYLLFSNIFQNESLTQYATIAVPLLSVIGAGLPLLQAFIGAGAGRAMRDINEYKGVQSIKTDVQAANVFVDGLIVRYAAIQSAAQAAEHSVERLAQQFVETENANLPLVSALDEQRTKFLAAVEAVDPRRWPEHLAGETADGLDIGRTAWMMPIGLLVLLGAFILLMAGVFARAGVGSAILPYAAAAAAGFACCVAGGFLFNRIVVATEHAGDLRERIWSRDEIKRLLGVAALGLIVLCLLVVGYYADGLLGLLEGAVASALGLLLCAIGNNHDQITKGLSFLFLTSAALLLMLFEALWVLLSNVALGVIALLGALLWWGSMILAAPILIPLRALKARRQPDTLLQPAAA